MLCFIWWYCINLWCFIFICNLRCFFSIICIIWTFRFLFFIFIDNFSLLGGLLFLLTSKTYCFYKITYICIAMCCRLINKETIFTIVILYFIIIVFYIWTLIVWIMILNWLLFFLFSWLWKCWFIDIILVFFLTTFH